jgi:hypothetical protein
VGTVKSFPKLFGAHLLGHQLIQRLDQVGHIAAPDRLRGPRDFEALPCEDIFQPIEGHIE